MIFSDCPKRAHDRIFFLRWAAAMVLLAVLPGAVFAQSQPAQNDPPAKSQAVTTAEIEKLLQQIEQAQNLDEETKTKATTTARQALEELERAATLTATQARFTEEAGRVQERLNEIKSQAAMIPSEADTGQLRSMALAEFGRLFPDLSLSLSNQEAKLAELSLPELKQLLPQLETHLTTLKGTLAELEAEPTRRAERRKELRELLIAAPQKLAELEKQLQEPPPDNEPALLTEAKKKLLEARRHALQQSAEAYRAELAKYDAEEAVDLVRERRKLIDRRVSLLTSLVNALRELISQRERAEADDLLKQARREASKANPRLRSLAEQNQQLAEEAKTVTERMQQAVRRLEEIERLRDETRSHYEQSRERERRAGLTGAIGLLLRKERAELPDVRQHQRNMRQRQEILREYQARLFELEDQRAELKDLEARIDEVASQVGQGLSGRQREQLEADARALLETRQELLDTLIRYYNSYTDDLVKLDSAEQELVEKTRDYRQFIDERVLWIQSTDRFGFGDLRDAGGGLMWLTRPRSWMGVAGELWVDVRNNPFSYLAMLVLLGLLIFYQPQLRKELRAIGEQAARSNCHDFTPTLRALLLTVMIAICWPALAACAAWRLSAAAETAGAAAEVARAEFAGALAFALWAVVLVAVPVELVRVLCRPKGLGAAHFDWAEAGVRLVRRYMRLFLAPTLMLAFVAAAMQAQGNEGWQNSLGRSAFVGALVVVAFCLARVLRPSGGLVGALIDQSSGGWTYRLRWIWYPLIVLAPLALAGLAAFGYYYTAWHLVNRLLATAWVLLAVLLARAVLLRWQLVNHRKLAFAEVRERLASLTSEPVAAEGAELPPQQVEEPGHALATISTQTRRLLNASTTVVVVLGLWLVWVDVLPALGILDRVELWHVTVSTSEPVTPLTTPAAPDAAAAPAETEQAPTEFRTVETRVPITLGDLFLAVLVLALTVVAAQNVPGLLEIGLLRHLPLDDSIRFAITTLASYLIVIVGVLVGFNAIGIGWSQVQWLAAALTFGLAFGLQEIFANFVSGLIILFERPIRVGDIVTLDGTTGTVSRIRIRATTITNWDRQELVVPNKEFITGRLLNWTLTDSVNRVTITVGVAYGSDTNKARDLIAQILQEHPVVLNDPAPLITFEQFGDSTLNIVIRAYLPNLRNRLATVHDLHTAIHWRFAEAGIEIAFPQRDLHIRSGVLPIRTADSNGAARIDGRETDEKNHVQEQPQAQAQEAANPLPHPAAHETGSGAGYHPG